MKWFYVSTKVFTCVIGVENNIITKTAPILQKFQKQNIHNLFDWLDSKFNNYKVIPLENEPQEEQNV